MLAKKFRFHRQNHVRSVYRKGFSARTKHTGLKYLEQITPGDNRVAVVVSKKVDKKAVTRNRIRRRMYEIIRKIWPETEQGHDLVFTVYDNVLATEKHEKLEKEVKDLLGKAKLLN